MLELAPNASCSHKYYAIFLGEKAGIQGVRQQLGVLTKMHSHIKLAVELDPGDPLAWYLEGAFYEKLLSLQWFEKKFVYNLIRDLVRPSHEDALRCLLKAEDLRPNFMAMNQFLIGKLLVDQKDCDDVARSYLERVANLRNLRTEDDKRAKVEAEKLLTKI